MGVRAARASWGCAIPEKNIAASQPGEAAIRAGWANMPDWPAFAADGLVFPRCPSPGLRPPSPAPAGEGQRRRATMRPLILAFSPEGEKELRRAG